MPTIRSSAARIWRLAMLLALAAASPTYADTDAGILPVPFPAPPEVFTKSAPETLQELKDIQDHVHNVVDKVMPAVVGVRVGSGQGSGVIVSADGYVLTAAHVSGPSGRPVQVVLPDGRVVRGETLGGNTRTDGGMIKITEKGPWPHAPMGNSGDLKGGDWCVAIGHPGGYKKGRTPVVRLGRVLDSFRTLIRTDCTLVGGDSGGPLFDMAGRVIGIHSRIGPSISYNIHVPVDTYREDWDVLTAGVNFPSNALMGVKGDPDGLTCKILEVTPDSPAARAGFQPDDIVVEFDGKKVGNFEELVDAVARHRPGQRVDVVIDRGGRSVTLSVTLGERKS